MKRPEIGELYGVASKTGNLLIKPLTQAYATIRTNASGRDL